MDIKSCILTCS